MILLDGKKVADEILEKLKTEVAGFPGKPGLAVILVGNDAPSLAYVKQKGKVAEHVGVIFHLHHLSEKTDEVSLLALIHKLNQDPSVSGILVQLPLPSSIAQISVIEAIDPRKDVDGFHPLNLGRLLLGEPCLASATPAGIIELMNYYKIALKGKRVVIVGRSNIVGKPLSVFLMNHGATVTVCHRDTEDLAAFTKVGDIIIVAVGQPGLLKGDMVKEGAVVIDAGWGRVEGAVVGDVDFQSVSKKVSYITPVPGGVGPMTVAVLIRQTVEAYKQQHNL